LDPCRGFGRGRSFMKLTDSILIDCPQPSLYQMLSDIERHAEILPGYLESRVVERKADSCVVQREAIIHGKRHRWKSEVWFEEGKAIHFRQSEGLLKGMRVDWCLDHNAKVSRLKIIHDVTLQPRWRGWWIERWVAKPAIEHTARHVLEAIKVIAEKQITTS
jgi:ribosome-associated toxin RatA of RatAB toxin-antitoxin module